MPLPVTDLHCDLLSYLADDPAHTIMDPRSRCSLPQLQEGGVECQVLALFAETEPRSIGYAQRQIDLYGELGEQPVQFRWAIENSSCFCDEEEELGAGVARLEQWIEQHGKPEYISLTWNGDNRFGGGTGTKRGITADGKLVLDMLVSLGIPCDLSHASDRLAEDILSHSDSLRLLASHANFRTITDHPRNLTDPVAKEVMARGGILGLALVRSFIGEGGHENILRHIDHGLDLGGENALAFGADFFCESAVPAGLQPAGATWFYPEFDNASCYPYLLGMLEGRVGRDLVAKLASGNAQTALRRSLKP